MIFNVLLRRMHLLFDCWTLLIRPDWHWRTFEVNTFKSLKIISNQIDRTQFFVSVADVSVWFEFYFSQFHKSVTMNYEVDLKMKKKKDEREEKNKMYEKKQMEPDKKKLTNWMEFYWKSLRLSNKLIVISSTPPTTNHI